MNTIKITDLEFINQIKKPFEKQLNQMFDEFGNEVEQLLDEDLSKVRGRGSGGWGAVQTPLIKNGNDISSTFLIKPYFAHSNSIIIKNL